MSLPHANAARLMLQRTVKHFTGTVLNLDNNATQVRVRIQGSINLDRIVTPWFNGRKIQIIAAAGNVGNLTLRDNQPSSNLEVGGTSISLGGFDSVWLRGDLNADGDRVWAQDSPVTNL